MTAIYNFVNDRGKTIPLKVIAQNDGTYILDTVVFTSSSETDETINFYVNDTGDTLPIKCKLNDDGTYSICVS